MLVSEGTSSNSTISQAPRFTKLSIYFLRAAIASGDFCRGSRKCSISVIWMSIGSSRLNFFKLVSLSCVLTVLFWLSFFNWVFLSCELDLLEELNCFVIVYSTFIVRSPLTSSSNSFTIIAMCTWTELLSFHLTRTVVFRRLLVSETVQCIISDSRKIRTWSPSLNTVSELQGTLQSSARRIRSCADIVALSFRVVFYATIRSFCSVIV